MAEERRRVKRAEVSDETRSGRHRAAVNPREKESSGRREKVTARARGEWGKRS